MTTITTTTRKTATTTASSSTSTSPVTTTTTPSDNRKGQQRRLYEPLPLTPLHHIIRAQRVHRYVRNFKPTTSDDDDCHSLVALQPISRRPTTTTTTTSGYKLPAAYVFDGILTENPKTGVAMVLAQPMTYEDPNTPTRCCLVSSGQPQVVIKAVPRPCLASKHLADNPISEIAAMQHLQRQGSSTTTSSTSNQHVIELLDCMQDEDFVYLILPYMQHGDLFSLVEKSDGEGLAEEQAKRYIREIAEGLLYMKRSGNIAHRDVSLENVMLTPEGHACIIDLGTALRIPQQHDEAGGGGPVLLSRRRSCGKASYVSPEVVRQDPCDMFAADIWSLGVCLYTMLTGRPLYNSSSDQAFAIMAKGGAEDVMTIYEGYGMTLPCDGAKQLLCQMLHADPTKRPTLEEVLTHSYLADATGDIAAEPELTTTTTTSTSSANKDSSTSIIITQQTAPSPWGQVRKRHEEDHHHHHHSPNDDDAAALAVQ